MEGADTSWCALWESAGLPGFLRFHTYNKRMIVFDETRTLVVRFSLDHSMDLLGAAKLTSS